MDLGTMLYNNLKDVPWSITSLPLDQLVTSYRLPQIVRLDTGESVEGLRDNDYLLLHSCRQWTTITAHSLEEGHYVIGPKIEIPVHYEGQFKLLEQDRDIKEPVQYYNSVEEVAKAFPERVYVMEDISFNVKMASGECNEDTEVYTIALSTGDELTLMGQAEILYAKASREKSRLNTILKRIGKLNSLGKMGRGKMPCLICMNHRTNESVSLPFQCKGRFSTCSPLELRMQEGEHTVRDIVEKTRLPVNVSVPGGGPAPPRNPHDLHHIREGHRYKLVNVQTRTVVVCCALRSHQVAPLHLPLHAAMARVLLPEGMLQGELWLETMVHRWFSFCQEQFDIDDYSRAVRDVRGSGERGDEGKSPKRGSNGSAGPPAHAGVPSSLTYARDELTQSFHRLSVCVYGSHLHSNSEVNLQGCAALSGDWALLPSDSLPAEPADEPPPQQRFPEPTEVSGQQGAPPPPPQHKSEVPYEELWLDHLKARLPKPSCVEGPRGLGSCGGASTAAPCYPATGSDVSLAPPPVPPKSEAVKEECRLLNAPPIPPRGSRQTPSAPVVVAKARQQETRSPSPTLSYYSSGLHNIGGEGGETEEQSGVCYPCSWAQAGATTEAGAGFTCGSLPLDAASSRLSWPNNFSGAGSRAGGEDLLLAARSYYSYPRKRSAGAQKTASLCDFDGRGRGDLRSQRARASQFCTKSSSFTLDTYGDTAAGGIHAQQSLSCPILPPRTSRPSAGKRGVDAPPATVPDGEPRTPQQAVSQHETPAVASPPTPPVSSPWQPPSSLVGLSIEEVSRSLRFIGLTDDVVSLFVSEKIDGNLLLQLTEEILAEDFRLSKLQVKKLLQFMSGWRPKI